MKKVKNFFSKKKKEDLVTVSNILLEKEQGGVEIDSNVSDQSSSVIIIDKEVLLEETKKTSSILEVSNFDQEEFEVVSLSEESTTSKKEKNNYGGELVNAQQWLDQNYSKKERGRLKKLYIDKKFLEGELDLRDFVSLEEICVSHYLDKEKIKIKNKKEGSKFVKLINAQGWLDDNYPKRIRTLIKELYIRKKNLEGELDLRDFVNLEKLDCSWNQLFILKLKGLSKLKEVSCNDNFLTELDCSLLDINKFSYLNMSDNNIYEKTLSDLKHLVNLKNLWLGSDDEIKIRQGIYNRFYGSLEPLKNLNKLRFLHISNTDIDDGTDYLSESIEEIRYSTRERPESKVEKVAEKLNSFLSSGKKSKSWRNIHPNFDKLSQKRWEDLGFDYQGTKEWIEVNLQPEDYHFAAWLRLKGYNSQQKIDWKRLRKENKSAQEWLKKEYYSEIKDWLNWLDISRSGLEGNLVISDFPKLEKIDCRQNQITSLTLKNLPKIKDFNASNNKLVELNINNCLEINRIDIANNFLKNLNFLNELDPNKIIGLIINNNDFPPQDINIFSKFKGLRKLLLASNNFYGTLESLKKIDSLEILNITDTEINSGFEYLPGNLKEISSNYSQNLKKNTEFFKLIRWTGFVKKTDNHKYHNIPFYNFRYWKESQPYFKWLKKEIEKLNPNLDVYDVIKDIFFNVKTGEFVGNHQAMLSLLNINKVIIDEKQKEINFLELSIQKLNDRIKEQWEKVHNAYLYCVSKPEEKELLDQLIKKHIEFARFKKQWFNSPDYRKKCREYKNRCQTIESNLEELLEGRLETEIVEETMNKVEQILTECEEITNWQLELEEKISNKSLLLEEKKQVPQITVNKEYIKLLSENIGNQLILYQKENEKSRDELKRLQQEIHFKKVQRQELLNKLQSQSTSVDDNDWLKALLSVQKKDPNSEELDQIKEILESHKINRKQLEKLCQIQKEINELKKQEKEQEELSLTAQVEIIPSSSQN